MQLGIYLNERQRQIVRGAKEILTQYGWRQNNMGLNSYGRPQPGGVCLAGALVAASNNRPGFYEADLVRLVHDLDWRLGRTTTWNDRQGRTVEEVFDLLDRLLAESSRMPWSRDRWDEEFTRASLGGPLPADYVKMTLAAYEKMPIQTLVPA